MHIVTHTDELAQACADLARADFVTVDTEFMRDSSYWSRLCFLQMAGPDSTVLVDPLACGLDLAPFYALMADKSVIKVLHAGRQDIEIFYHNASVIPDPVFDTQVGAMVCGFGEAVSYEMLARRLAGAAIDKSSRLTDWSRRPLTAKQLEYAASDVTHLRRIYESLSQQIVSRKRASWVAQEMLALQNPQTYDLAPETAWRRLKARVKGRRNMAVLMEAAAWRERQAQRRNVPRGRILKDTALYEIAVQSPRSAADIDALRTVPRGFGRGSAARGLLEAVERGLARDPATVPCETPPPALPAGMGPLVDLLKVLLKHQCERHHVAQKLVASTADLERIAAGDIDVPALSGWRREAFGNAALDLQNGRIALGVGCVGDAPAENTDAKAQPAGAQPAGGRPAKARKARGGGAARHVIELVARPGGADVTLQAK